MHRTLITLSLLVSVNVAAQEMDLRIDKSDKIIFEQPEKAFIKPRWSPDGEKIALTGLNYQGLYVINTEGDDFRTLSEESGAGFNVYWSPDGRMISTTFSTFNNGRREEILNVFSADRGDLIQSVVFDKSIKFGFHGFVDHQNLLLNRDGTIERMTVTGKVNLDLSDEVKASTRKICLSIGTDMALYEPQTDVYRTVDPLPGAKYLTPVLSGDGALIVFRVYGDQMYVYDLNNDKIIPLGQGHHPRWSSDNTWIIFERQTDDGHNITSADLFITDRSGSRFGQITATPDILEVNPDWSPVSDSIIYEDLATGSIHLLEISNIR